MSPWPPVDVLYMTCLRRNRVAHEWQCRSPLDGPSVLFSLAFPWPYRRRKWDSQVYNCWGTFCCLSWKLGWCTPSSILKEVLQYLGWVWTDVLEVCLFVGWLHNVPATCECISGTDLLRQFYVLPHWDRSCRSNFPSHPVTVYWHRADQSQRWPYNARRLAG